MNRMIESLYWSIDRSSIDSSNFDCNSSFTLNYKINDLDSKLRFGSSFSYKTRDFTTNNYSIGFLGSSTTLNGDPNQILNPSNVWTLTDPQGSYTIGSFQRTISK